MTETQIKFLRRVIRSEIEHRTAAARGEIYVPRRECEVGWIAGVNPRTARALVDAGFLEYEGSDNPGQTWVQYRSED
jgi:hypothetical protein